MEAALILLLLLASGSKATTEETPQPQSSGAGPAPSGGGGDGGGTLKTILGVAGSLVTGATTIAATLSRTRASMMPIC